MSHLLYTKYYNDLINKLKNTRKSLNIKQVEIATLLQKPQSFISKYENCEIKIDLETLAKICFILKIDDIKLYKEFSDKVKETIASKK